MDHLLYTPFREAAHAFERPSWPGTNDPGYQRYIATTNFDSSPSTETSDTLDEYGQTNSFHPDTLSRSWEKPPFGYPPASEYVSCSATSPSPKYTSPQPPPKVISQSGTSSRPRRTCTQCGRDFSSPKDLRRHNLTHSDQRRYVCNGCEQDFKRKDHLERHRRNKHGGDVIAQPISKDATPIMSQGAQSDYTNTQRMSYKRIEPRPQHLSGGYGDPTWK